MLPDSTSIAEGNPIACVSPYWGFLGSTRCTTLGWKYKDYFLIDTNKDIVISFIHQLHVWRHIKVTSITLLLLLQKLNLNFLPLAHVVLLYIQLSQFCLNFENLNYFSSFFSLSNHTNDTRHSKWNIIFLNDSLLSSSVFMHIWTCSYPLMY